MLCFMIIIFAGKVRVEGVPGGQVNFKVEQSGQKKGGATPTFFYRPTQGSVEALDEVDGSKPCTVEYG